MRSFGISGRKEVLCIVQKRSSGIWRRISRIKALLYLALLQQYQYLESRLASKLCRKSKLPAEHSIAGQYYWCRLSVENDACGHEQRRIIVGLY